MTAYFHLLCRRRPHVEMDRYAHRLRRFIRKNHKKHQYTYQLYRNDTVLRVTVMCDPQEVDQALRDMGDAMVKLRLHHDWECFNSVLNEDPTEVLAEDLDMAQTKPWREPKPKPKPKPKLHEGAKSAGFFSFFSCFSCF